MARAGNMGPHTGLYPALQQCPVSQLPSQKSKSSITHLTEKVDVILISQEMQSNLAAVKPLFLVHKPTSKIIPKCKPRSVHIHSDMSSHTKSWYLVVTACARVIRPGNRAGGNSTCSSHQTPASLFSVLPCEFGSVTAPAVHSDTGHSLQTPTANTNAVLHAQLMRAL